MHQSVIKKVVIDESVSDTQVSRFRQYLSSKSIAAENYYYIAKEYPGIPDMQILRHLLDASTVLLTTDRPFHNTALAAGKTSFYVSQEGISDKPIARISVQRPLPLSKAAMVLKESYLPQSRPLPGWLLSESESRLKKLRVKGRRIKSHFGGIDNIGTVSVSVSAIPYPSGILIGVRVHVASNSGIKGLEASESYTGEKLEKNTVAISAAAFACIVVAQLRLHGIKTIIYFDSACIEAPPEDMAADPANCYLAILSDLKNLFADLRFVPVAKGAHIERLRRKLCDLRVSPNNEILYREFGEVLGRYCSSKV